MSEVDDKKVKTAPSAEAEESNRIVFPDETNCIGTERQPTTVVGVSTRHLISGPPKQTDAHGNQPDIVFE